MANSKTTNDLLESLPIDTVLALAKLVSDDSKSYKAARKLAQPGRSYKGTIDLSLDYEVNVAPAGGPVAVRLDPWAILAALLDTPDGLEAVQDAAERAYHYREGTAHVRGVAKESAQDTWDFTRPGSIRLTVRNELRSTEAATTTTSTSKAGGE